MRKLFSQFLLITFLFLTGFSGSQLLACNYTHLTLDSTVADTGGTYFVYFQFCVGGGYDPPGDASPGADSETMHFWFETFGATIQPQLADDYSYPDTLCSGMEILGGCGNCQCAIVKRDSVDFRYPVTCGPTGSGCPYPRSLCPGGLNTCLWYTANHNVANGYDYNTTIPNPPCTDCPGPPGGSPSDYKSYTHIFSASGPAASYCTQMYIRTMGLPDSVRVHNVEGWTSARLRYEGDCSDMADLKIDLTILPVLLNYFEATPMTQRVDLEWETAAEMNNDFFIVEKSFDGKDYFEIGTLGTKGPHKESSGYTYSDMNPVMGVNHYRLIEVNNQGGRSEIGSAQVKFTEQTESRINYVKPIPASDYVDVSLFSDMSQNFEIEISDIRGAIINKKKYFLNQGETVVRLPLSELAPGAYFLHVKNARLNLMEKIIKY